LRERRGDIPLLVEHFLGVYAGSLQEAREPALGGGARDALLAYSWPGNIRELENVIERCVLLADDNTIRLRDLSTEVREHGGLRGGSWRRAATTRTTATPTRSAGSRAW
jgi:DNA-binding NtrC family response regulator